MITKQAKVLLSQGNKPKSVAINNELRKVTDKISSVIDMMAESENPTPFMRKVQNLEEQRDSIIQKLNAAEQDDVTSCSLSDINEFDVQRALNAMFKQLDIADSENLKDFIRTIIDKVVIEPENQTRMMIHYSINIRGFNMASPRGFEPLLPP